MQLKTVDIDKVQQKLATFDLAFVKDNSLNIRLVVHSKLTAHADFAVIKL